MKRSFVFASGTCAALAASSLARGADLPTRLPLKAPIPTAIYNWTGVYVGGQVGYGQGGFGPGTNPITEQAVFFGMTSGFQAGFNLQLPNRLVLGAEVDALFTSVRDLPKLNPA